jgi:hypothetical protein
MTFDFAGANKISPIVEMTKKQYRGSTSIGFARHDMALTHISIATKNLLLSILITGCSQQDDTFAGAGLQPKLSTR